MATGDVATDADCELKLTRGRIAADALLAGEERLDDGSRRRWMVRTPAPGIITCFPLDALERAPRG
jgi:hypothetical protein